MACTRVEAQDTNVDTSTDTNADTNDVLLLDSMGRLVVVPTNEVPSQLQPPSDVGVKDQIPTPAKGTLQPAPILQRSRRAITHAEFFPGVPPALMPYLASQDEYGNTAIAPGPLVSFAPFEPWVEGTKYQLSTYGFRYSLVQTFTYVAMDNVKQGAENLGFYTFDLKSKWALYDVPNTAAGWISSQLQAKSGLGTDGDNQSAKSNLGTLTNPTGIWAATHGLRVPELAWQQSLMGGQVVAVAGMVSQRLYIDDNAYANSGRSKFMNSALINSGVMPLAHYNFGFNLQWQPRDEWYGMIGGSAGNAPAGNAPWTDFSWQDWSLPMEFGYAPRDVFGLGPGIYRIQPFAASVKGTTGGGVCLDLQQKLGAESPFGWFGRFGFGSSHVASSADNQIGTGFVAQGPFKHYLLNRTSNDFLGTGFVWSQPAETTQTVNHRNEYVWETVYVVQLTPTLKLMPDLQEIWDPVFHNVSHCMVFQLQLSLAW